MQVILVDAVYLVVAGDFNCAVNSRLYGAYCDFLKEEQLLCVDSQHIHDVFTYVSDDGKNTFVVLHCFCALVKFLFCMML